MSKQPLTPEFIEREVPGRGVTYRLRELTAGEYEQCREKATTKKTDAFGQEYEAEDGRLLLKLLILATVAEPKLKAEDLVVMPARVRFSLNRAVNDLYFGEEEPAKPEAEAEPEEGPAKGND